MRIFVADDHAMFGVALQYLLKASDEASEVLTVASVPELLQTLAEHPMPDMILMDYSMPQVDGLTGLDRIHAKYPDARVAILSGHTDAVLVRAALSKGAAGWIPKSLTPTALIHALRLMREGQRFVPPELLDVAPSEELSEREGQVAILLAQGHSDKTIADHLGIEPSTVKVHVRRILKKSGATNRAQFAAMSR